ncbi:MAG TPA: GGDEF domain-containing protein [Pelagibacterium sp.]|uniref:GGDEF domain-containing protein n=1 Tax=Pelagibacterium sp. TaxID=1967288 RepID=UPI002CDBD8F2|nr:GGDEF domain-containing protein [Pelagibacterium sp.]HWJ89440.1 GGDEF domain-containing protein [Pelagibacterium sp.]
MGFDYNSLLMASGAAGIALCFTLLISWMRERASGFLLTWAISIAIIIMAIGGFSIFHSTGNGVLSTAAGILMVAGFAGSYGGMTQFRDGRLDYRTTLILGGGGTLPILIVGVLGYDGLGFGLTNLISAMLLAYCGYQYWLARRESPGPISAIGLLHGLLAFSYLLCAIVALTETPLYLNGQSPDNWAEGINLVAAVIAITGIGGLFITIHQERISRRHQVASLTDALTGIQNRRALFEHFSIGIVPQGTALVVFDLDNFKVVNDRHGHGVGDMVLRSFAAILVENCRAEDMAVRLGGEEFVLVLSDSSSVDSLALAERIRAIMGRTSYPAGDESIVCTVSAGVAIAEKTGVSLDTLIRKADNALYLSKRSGRNRVSEVKSNAA